MLISTTIKHFTMLYALNSSGNENFPPFRMNGWGWLDVGLEVLRGNTGQSLTEYIFFGVFPLIESLLLI